MLNRFSRQCCCAIIAACTALPASAQIIYTNGPFRTGATSRSGVAAPAGTQWSEVQSNTGNTTESNTSAGPSGNAGSFRLADNFVVPPGQVWSITHMYTHGYRTGAPLTPTPFTAVTLQIWSGRPGDAGAFVVFGDTTTNRLVSSVDSLAWRIFNTTVPAPGTAPTTTRKIWRNRVAVSPTLDLGPGEYWVDFDGAAGGNHFYPLVTLVGNRGDSPPQGWNSRQFSLTTGLWTDFLDTGNPATAPDIPQDLAFDLEGSTANVVTGGCCFADGTCRTFTPTNCNNAGGSYQGDNTNCSACRGSCCFTDGSCQTVSETQCSTLAGSYLGNGTNCTSNPCDLPGACCQTDGTCTTLTNSACTNAGGVWSGANTNCGTVTYAVSDSANNFENTLNSASPLSLDSGNADDGSGLVSIGFPFSFFGVTQTQVRVSVNGYLTFSGTASDGNFATNAPIPSAGNPNSLIAPFWQDLDTTLTGNIGTQTDGAAPNRRFIVQWTNVPIFAIAGTSETFQVLLYESSNIIEFRYGGIDSAPPRSAVVGVENATGLAGTAIPNASLASGNAYFLTPSATTTCTQPAGACCTLLGTCSQQTARDCQIQNGIWSGGGVSCASANCQPVGACCVGLSCTIRTSSDCAGQGGTFGGAGSVCNPNGCAGACCDGSGSCQVSSQSDCQANGGTFRGAGTVCDPNDCLGACCFEDGSCTRVALNDCANQNGNFLGAGSECGQCPLSGRCCTTSDCVIRTPTGCAALGGGYVFGGGNSVCEQVVACSDALHWNGPLGTNRVSLNSTIAPVGAGWSEVQNDNATESNTNAGIAGSFQGTDATSFRLADDFTVPAGEVWTLNSAEFLAYQTGSLPGASPFTAYNMRIWNGPPGDGGSVVIAGDTTSNVMVSTTFSTLYRVFNTAVPPPGTATTTTRPIFRNRCNFIAPVVLPAGTYWIDWQSTINANAAHFAPTTTVVGQRTQAGWNARQFSGATGLWTTILDAGNPATAPDVQQDFPFRVFGSREILPAACCLGQTCELRTQSSCQTAGGIYQGNGTTCSPSPCGPPRVPGDMNCDTLRDGDDLSGWVLAWSDPAGYSLMFPNCNIRNGDFTNDGLVTMADTAGMVDCILNGNCQ